MSDPSNISGVPGGGATASAESIRQEAEAKLRALHAEPTLAEQSNLTPGAIVALLLAVAAIIAGWYHTFGEMWLRWFEAWPRTNLPLMDRLTEGDSYYTHGPLVPLTCLVIAFFIYRKVGAPVRRSASASAAGWALFGGSLFIHFVASVAGGVNFASGFALIGVIGGLVLILGGWPLARVYWIPVVLLVFMVPLSMGAIAHINFGLKYFAADQAMWLTTQVFGVPAYQDGATVHLMPGPDGVPKTLVVENVCGGLRSLISLTFFAALFAAVCRVTRYWRLFLLLMAVPVAIFCNVLRITSLNLVAHYHSVAEAGPNGAFHDLSGLLMFVLALGILFGLEWLIIFTGKRLGRNWSDNRLMGFLEDGRQASAPRPQRSAALASWTCAALLIVVGGLSIFFVSQTQGMQVTALAANAVPREVTLRDGPFTSTADIPLDEASLTILQTEDYLYRIYQSPDRNQSMRLLIVFSSNNRKGTHEPEVCIEGGGLQITAKTLREVEVPGLGVVTLRELLAQRGNHQTLYYYVYKAGDTYTPRFIYQQAVIFVNGLLRGNSSGALIRFDVPVRDGRVDESRALMAEAVRALMPEMDRNLP